MKIEMDKKYRTVVGHYPVRIICTDQKSDRPVVALLTFTGGEEFILSLDSKGYIDSDDCQPYIEEVPEVDWSKVEIDTPVWIKRYGLIYRRHFSGINSEGIPTYWSGGATSHSIDTPSGISQTVAASPSKIFIEKPIL